MGCWAGPVCDSLGVAGWPGVTCSSSSTCHSGGQGSCFQQGGCRWGRGASGQSEVPRTGAGEHKSVLHFILSLLRTGRKASNTQKTPMVYAREVYQPQSPAMCSLLRDNPAALKGGLHSLQTSFTHISEHSPVLDLLGYGPPSPLACGHHEAQTTLPHDISVPGGVPGTRTCP